MVSLWIGVVDARVRLSQNRFGSTITVLLIEISADMKPRNTYFGALNGLLAAIAIVFVLNSSATAQKLISADKDTKEPLLLSIGPIGA